MIVQFSIQTIYILLSNAPPTQVNTWFRFRSSSVSGTPTIPTEVSGNLTYTQCLHFYTAKQEYIKDYLT